MNLEESIRNVVEGKKIVKEAMFDTKGEFYKEIMSVDDAFDELHNSFEELTMALDNSDDANNIKFAGDLSKLDAKINSLWSPFAKVAKKL